MSIFSDCAWHILGVKYVFLYHSYIKLTKTEAKTIQHGWKTMENIAFIPCSVSCQNSQMQSLSLVSHHGFVKL